MKNFKFNLLAISILTILYSCSKDESNPLAPDISPSYSIQGIDSTLVADLTVEMFYPDSVIFNCVLTDTNFTFIELFAEAYETKPDCSTNFNVTIQTVSKKSSHVRLKADSYTQYEQKVSIFSTAYKIVYWQNSVVNYTLAIIYVNPK